MATVGEDQELRARVEALERERFEEARRANAAVAAAQERVYWLDRWQIDLNALMRRRGMGQVREALKGLRWLLRRARTARERLRG